MLALSPVPLPHLKKVTLKDPKLSYGEGYLLVEADMVFAVERAHARLRHFGVYRHSTEVPAPWSAPVPIKCPDIKGVF